MRVRVVPSILRSAARLRIVPASLAFGFAAYLHLLRSSMPLGVDAEAERVRAHWRSAADEGEATLRRIVDDVAGDTALWHADLSHVPHFTATVTSYLQRITKTGVAAALATHLAERTSHAPAFSGNA
jgi:mannitol-1-phosphate/altronate dehydrogenase